MSTTKTSKHAAPGGTGPARGRGRKAVTSLANVPLSTKPSVPLDTNGSGPFGGLKIDFSNDIDAVPLANAVGPIVFGDALAPGSGVPVTPHGEGSRASKLIIVGSGPAGLTAAIYAARANLEPIVLAGSAPGGQLMITSDVENYPGFPDSVQGPELMAQFRAQAERFGAQIVDVDVERVDFSSRPFRLWARGTEYRGEAVVVATGASALWLGLASEMRLRGRGVSACATCDGFFFRDQVVAVIGGGDTALEEAIFLTRFATKVHLLHRRESLRGSKIMQDRALANPRIEFHPNVVVEDMLGGPKVEALRLRDVVTGQGWTLPVDGVFVAIGYKPNTDVFRDWLEVDPMGYLVVRDETASRIDGVFIAGDVHDHRYRQAVTAAGDGCRAAIDAERWLEVQGITELQTATAW